MAPVAPSVSNFLKFARRVHGVASALVHHQANTTTSAVVVVVGAGEALCFERIKQTLDVFAL